MKLSELRQMFEAFERDNGDMEALVYDRHGDSITPRSIQTMLTIRGRDSWEAAYISDEPPQDDA